MKRMLLSICLISGCQNVVTPPYERTDDNKNSRSPDSCHAWDDRFIYARPDIIKTSQDFECLRRERKSMKDKLAQKVRKAVNTRVGLPKR
ncbi:MULTISPECIES: hypothetical protein [unclassified Pantoea]|uniref:hypothetical protein n=1 Tax=unclassified Pantoea TaxID=2630326 RepID=UPI00301BEEA3